MRCSREALDLDIEFVGFDFVEKTRLSMSFKVHFQRWGRVLCSCFQRCSNGCVRGKIAAGEVQCPAGWAGQLAQKKWF